jgi:hypothetical protein
MANSKGFKEYSSRTRKLKKQNFLMFGGRKEKGTAQYATLNKTRERKKKELLLLSRSLRNVEQICAKIAIPKVSDAGNNVLFLVEVRVHLCRHDRNQRKPCRKRGNKTKCKQGESLSKEEVEKFEPRVKGLNALRARNDVEKDDVAFLDTTLQQNLNGLDTTATRRKHGVLYLYIIYIYIYI